MFLLALRPKSKSTCECVRVFVEHEVVVMQVIRRPLCSLLFSFASAVCAFLCVCVCDFAHQVSAASSSLLTGFVHTQIANTNTLSGGTRPFCCCCTLMAELNQNRKRCQRERETYLVQSLKSSLHGLCSSFSRHPATISWGTSGRWAADLRVTGERDQGEAGRRGCGMK